MIIQRLQALYLSLPPVRRNRIIFNVTMGRAHRYLFVLVTWVILIVLYRSSSQLPRLGTASFSAGWSLSSRPAESHSESLGKHSQKDSSISVLPTEGHSDSLSNEGPTGLPDKALANSPIKHLKPLKTDSRFISWLSARVPVDRVPFITIGDCKYIHALRNFRNRLEQWGYGDDLIVICLDHCCADARDYHAYTRFIGESVAFVKVCIL
jgi:hypothetical protein